MVRTRSLSWRGTPQAYRTTCKNFKRGTASTKNGDNAIDTGALNPKVTPGAVPFALVNNKRSAAAPVWYRTETVHRVPFSFRLEVLQQSLDQSFCVCHQFSW